MVYEIILLVFMIFGVVYGEVKIALQMVQSFWGTFISLFAYLFLLNRIGVWSRNGKHISRYNNIFRQMARTTLFFSLMYETAYGFVTHGKIYERPLIMNIALFVLYTGLLVFSGGYERIFMRLFKRNVIK